jgi:hypothetical protein
MKIGPRRQYETESTYPPAYAELPYSDWTKDTRGAAADLQTTALGGTGTVRLHRGRPPSPAPSAPRSRRRPRHLLRERVGKQGRVPACFRSFGRITKS